MLKVLFLSPLGNERSGGIAKWTSNILSYYKQQKSDVELIHCYNTNLVTVFDGDTIISRINKGIQNYLPLYKQVKSIIKNRHIDVLHLCTSASISLIKDIAILQVAKRKKIHTIVHFHFGRIPTIYKRDNWERILLNYVATLADEIIVMDNSSYLALKNNGFCNVHNVPNPLSLETQAIIEKNRDIISRQQNKIVFVGQLIVTKGIFELINAVKNLHNITVKMIGVCPNKNTMDEIKNIAGNDYKNWLLIMGTLPFELVIKEMLSASVFVLPTYTEGFPNVIIESMACGCPIVSCPVGAIPEMLNIHGSKPCGICVPPKNIDALKEAIINMLENPEQALIMGENAKNRVFSEYSIESVWEKLCFIWKSSCTSPIGVL